MALVMISGYPCSGKTQRALQLAQELELIIGRECDQSDDKISGDERLPSEKKMTKTRKQFPKEIILINDETLGICKDMYKDSRSERLARAKLLSAIERALSQDCVVIADALNYIKGFRYQLFCLAKAAKLPSCVIHIGTPEPLCAQWNSQRSGDRYPDELIHELVMRYEEPNSMNRWDAPTYTVIYSDEFPPSDRIWSALVNHDPVKPNLATVVKPFEGSTYLADLEKSTQQICSFIQDQISLNRSGSVKIPNIDTVYLKSYSSFIIVYMSMGYLHHIDTLQLSLILLSFASDILYSFTNRTFKPLYLPAQFISYSQLQRQRRQFLTLMRAKPLSDTGSIFINYLNTQWSNSES